MKIRAMEGMLREKVRAGLVMLTTLGRLVASYVLQLVDKGS